LVVCVVVLSHETDDCLAKIDPGGRQVSSAAPRRVPKSFSIEVTSANNDLGRAMSLTSSALEHAAKVSVPPVPPLQQLSCWLEDLLPRTKYQNSGCARVPYNSTRSLALCVDRACISISTTFGFYRPNRSSPLFLFFRVCPRVWSCCSPLVAVSLLFVPSVLAHVRPWNVLLLVGSGVHERS